MPVGGGQDAVDTHISKVRYFHSSDRSFTDRDHTGHVHHNLVSSSVSRSALRGCAGPVQYRSNPRSVSQIMRIRNLRAPSAQQDLGHERGYFDFDELRYIESSILRALVNAQRTKTRVQYGRYMNKKNDNASKVST